MLLPPPRELRDTFTLLAMLDGDLGLDRLVERIDWNGVTPQQVSYAVLGRLPQDIHYSGLIGALFEPAAYFKALLLRPEFQSNIVSSLLAAFPEKPRRFFVHVPRCGGTSLVQTLTAEACMIHYNAVGPEWCSGHVFLETIAAICRNIPRHDAIHVSGHYTLRSLIDERLARFGDSIWTSVRAPQEIILSYVNYVLTTLETDPTLSRPDARHWNRLLDLDGPPGKLSAEGLRALLPRMIRNDTLVPKNLLSHFLGDGTAASALDLLAAADVEVIDTARLDQWREKQWNVPARPWANVSRGFFHWNGLNEAGRRQINAVIRQDVTLHRTIAAALDGKVSVSGLHIARSSVPSASPASRAFRYNRIRRAARPILLDPVFSRIPVLGGGEPAGHQQVGWADPPLDYRTIETTVQLPLIQTRIRIRYGRRKPGFGLPQYDREAWRRGMRRLLKRLGIGSKP